MHVMTAIGVFVLATIVGFGIGSFRTAGVTEFMHLATACEVVKIAKAKGYIGDSQKLADAVAAAPGTDAPMKDLMQRIRTSKNC